MNIAKRILYRLKRHTTITPRYLPNEYTDECDLLIHLNFELLMRFLESNEIKRVDWYESGHKIGDEFVIDIWMRLYDWYKNDFMAYYHNKYEEAIQKCCPEPISWTTERDGIAYFELQFASPDDERKWHECMEQMRELEARYERAISDNLKLLIDTRPYMWT